MQALTANAVAPARGFRKIWVWTKAIVLAVVVFVPLFMINLPQALFWLVSPLVPGLRDWSARFFAGTYWSYIVWMLEKVPQLRVEIRSRPEKFPLGENAVMIANHQSYVDPLVLLVIAYRLKAVGDLRFFVKEQLKYVPGPGWGMFFLDCIFLKRNWQQDASNMQKYFDRYKKKKYPTLIHIFAEGTRRTPAKQEATIAYAREKGRDAMTEVLWPRTKGLIATLDGMGSHLDALYDVTIIYPGHKIPTLWDVFLGEFRHIEVQMERYSLKELPVEAEDRTRWVVDRFYEKDRLLRQRRGIS